jgi:AcrR family transcriptional regulator
MALDEARADQGCERKRLSAAERRAAILRAARTAFARHGFHGASTNVIAVAAGCSEPMLYRHFDSKHDLFAATLEDATNELRGRVQEKLEKAAPQNELEAIAAMVERLCDEQVMLDVSRLRMLALTLADDPKIREALDISYSGMRQRVVRVVREGQIRGDIRDDVDPDVVSFLWIGFTLAAAYRYSVEGPSVLPELSEMPKTLLHLLRTSTKEVSA